MTTSALCIPYDAPEEDPWAGLIGARVGNFVIERPLARGGMGAVFVAKHPALGREVAAKFLNPELASSPEVARRFLDEARLTAELRHPNIVEIFDFGELDGRLYYVMELLRGRDLAAEMKAHGRYAPADLRPYVTQVCDALDAAHSAGVVHRDLKPANVFVLEGAKKRVKLMDFGVAKMLDQRRSGTLHGQIIGTPSHMAPEQALGHTDAIKPQTDLYALGVTLYEMLTGARPFENATDLGLIMMHVTEAVPPIRERAPEVPEEVAAQVEACLAKSPLKRPASARSFAEAMLRAIDAPTRAPVVALDVPTVIPPRAVAAPVIIVPPVRAPDIPAAPVIAAPAIAAPMAAAPVAAAPVIAAPAIAAPVIAAPAIAAPAPALVPVIAAPAPALVPAPAQAPALVPVAALAAAQTLDAEEEVILEKLLRRAQRKGDFPAFVRNVTEISNKADVKSQFSARHLSDAILKDYALTAKLLSAVNHSSARTAGKIHSVQAAVVLLGFERVRTLALSLSVFKLPSKREQRPELRDSAIKALVSGEIARALGGRAKVEDAEQAMVCAMFCNLGRHVVLHSLPEAWAEANALMAKEGLSEDAALRRVLGIGVDKLGVGIARRWRLPASVHETMAARMLPPPKVLRKSERAGALAIFSNELCDAIALEREDGEEGKVAALLARHQHLLMMRPDEVPALLEQVRAALDARYAALLGTPGAKASRYAKAVEPPEPAPDVAHAAHATPEAHARLEAPKVAPFLMARVDAEAARADERARSLEARADELAHARHGPTLEQVLEALVAAGFRRAVALTATPDRKQLVVRHARGEDAHLLEAKLALPLGSAVTLDPFSSAFHSSRVVVIEDVFEPAATARVPRLYYELVGSPAFLLQPCGRGASYFVVMCDVASAEHMPSASLKAAIAKVCALVGRPT